ncbi:fructose bisphosphate aldolase [Erysipelothrix sp. HDW6C]|uniref:fructose bisphosphate aldolase n=1 Tax=Erysipelothrix sp. HDW6C TaxID=2714930 RepID=UPI00140CB0F9|nr:fructose bisphosphate aldolase [Erysipelothrix sp. HDW6C]QIK69427.1 fructose bisphosphate aldolase [Erysipelothrix sp. HDW6C]
MDTKKLEIMKNGKGFIAALDQSGGSTPKALKAYGIDETAYHNDEEMFYLVHQMRTRIITAPVFTSENILGAILFEQTMDRLIDERYTADYLWDVKGILPFLKIDNGLAEEADGVQLMKPIPELDALLERAVARHIFGTKMRSVVKRADKKGIERLVDQQFEVAKKIASFGLVPIIEPEVDITIPDKEEAEVLLKIAIYERLLELDEDVKVMFKLSLPTVDDFYLDLMDDRHVVRVVALSGGYSQAEANDKLRQNHGLIASFSRALVEGLSDQQTEKEFNHTLGNSIKQIAEASTIKF